jgi:alpha-glucosidase
MKSEPRFLQKALLALRFLGPEGTRRALFYALLRDYWNRTQPVPRTPWRGVGPPQAMVAIPGGGRFLFPEGELEAVFLEGGLRLTWTPGRLPPPYAIEKAPALLEPEREEGGGRFALAAGGVRLEVGPEGLLFLDERGRVWRREALPERQGEAWRHRVDLAPGERLHGLGAVAAPLDRRGRSYRLWNRDVGGSYGPDEGPLYLTIPLLLSRKPGGGYLVFYENPHEAFLDLSGDVGLVAFSGGALRYYLFPGGPKEALAAYTALTGRPPLPPRFALGLHFARWGLRTEEEAREVVEGFFAHDLPLSALHLDIDYMDGYRVFTVDRRRFPHLEGLVRDLEGRGVRTVLILDPGVKAEAGFPPFEAGLKEGVFCTLPGGRLLKAPVWPGWCAFPDFTSPKARAWWGERCGELLALGVHGFWLDMNEPAAFAAWGDPTLPGPTRHALEGQEGDHREAHNLYGLLMARATHEALRARGVARPFIFSRSGFAGLARYAWNWTGDVESSWEALRRTVGIVLGLGLSGVPYTGSDIGGFSGHPSPELFLRWFQAAAFMPFFRLHSAISTPRREPWRFGEPVVSVLRNFLRLRHALIPYLYTLAWEAREKGYPLVRPLFFLDPEREAEDAFLLGEDLLVAPVVEEGARHRLVPLPKGPWYEFWSDRLVEGPGEVFAEAPLERIPIFVRAGAALPLAEGEGLVLHLYPGPEGRAEGSLYWDEGDGEGPSRLDRFLLEGGRLLWQGEGDYPWPWEGLGLRLHGAGLKGGRVGDAFYPVQDGLLRLPPFHEAFLEVGE